MTIETFNTTNLQSVRADIEAGIASIQNTLDDVELTLGNCTYGETEATFKLKVKIKGAKSTKQIMLKSMAKLFNLDVDKVHIIDKEPCKLHGYNTKASKMPWEIADSQGNVCYKLTDDQAKQCFGSLVNS